MNRRNFLRNSGMALGAATMPASAISSNKGETHPFDPRSWSSVRGQFLLQHDRIQMAQMLLASHPKPVRDAIAKHRKALEESPAEYWESLAFTQEDVVREAAAKYMKVDATEIALTDSTTQGLAMLFNGMKLQPGDEILSTTHDHYVTDKSIDYACQKKGMINRRIAEYDDPREVSVDQVVSRIKDGLSQKTRVVMVTWVHSCTGVKLPLRAIADMLTEVNKQRDEDSRIYFCVDGVHGFGNQDEDVSSLGCDFFVAGTHKWICGPRGTGVFWASKSAWAFVEPTVPAFSMNPYLEWLGLPLEGPVTFAQLCTPGGFHAFEHRWALDSAFEFLMEIGRDRIHQRTSELSTRLKEQMDSIPNIHLHTPMASSLSAGINCFEISGFDTDTVVQKLHDRGIIASASPYRESYVRLTPCMINTEHEVDRCIQVLQTIKS